MKVDKLLARLRLAGAARQVHERQYGNAVRKLKREHESKLTIAQAAEIATRLDRILAARENQLVGKKGQLCERAMRQTGVGSKELYRLTLPAGADPGKRRLRLDFPKYDAIIKALCEITGEPVDRLRGELLRGSSRDPLYVAEDRWSDIDVVVAALEDIVARMSARHRWAEDYERTATVRLESRGRLHWPLCEPDELPPEDVDSPLYEEWESRTAATVDPQQMFYLMRPHEAELNPNGAGSSQRRSCAAYFDAGHLQGTDFFYVPHAYIGQVLLWDMPTAHADPVAYQVARLKQLAQCRAGANLQAPADEWDSARQAPFGQLDSVNRADLQYATWLIAYPHHLDHSRIVPALYQAGEEGGAWLMPIDSDSLAAVADAVWYDDQCDLTLLERLKSLLLAPDGEGPSSVECALDRTGPWLAYNPALAYEAQCRLQMQAIKAVARRASGGK